MNEFPLRHAALAAVALAVLAHPASARSEAAFAAALGNPLPGLATMAQLKAQPQTPPAPREQGPVAPAAAWKSVLTTAIQTGKLVTQEGQHIFTLTDEIKHPDGGYYVFQIHVLAIKNGDGSFRAHAAQLTVSEIRMLSGNVVGSELWVFDVSGAGRLEKVFTVNSLTRGTVTERGPDVPVSLATAETKERFEELVAYWSGNGLP